MDAFYASVEQRDNPALRGKPVIVGAPPTQRGVVCAASYEARKFGVRSAMPSITAGRLCPRGIFVRPRMEAYREESRAIMDIVRGSGALIEQVSVDEAYLDFSAQHQRVTADESLPSRPSVTPRLLSSSNFLPKRTVTQNPSGRPSCDLFHFLGPQEASC